MKIKYLYITLLSILLIISISQIFSIPPYAGNIFPIYKSGYFKELDKGFNITIDSFKDIKMMSRTVYAWIFIKDIQKKYDYKIKIYNNKGLEVPAPGEIRNSDDERVFAILNSINPQSYSRVKNGKYYSAIPVFAENKCKFCHPDINKKNIIGIMTFEREYDSYIYYSSERVIIFIFISLFLIIVLFFAIRWDPEKVVKELFDK